MTFYICRLLSLGFLGLMAVEDSALKQGLIMQKLTNSVQNYTWGGRTVLTGLYGTANPTQQPVVKLWMEAYPKSNSQVLGADGQTVTLRDVIEHNKSTLLGDAVTQRFGELSFLLRVLCAAQPFSIRVHPNKYNSEIGFAKENAAGIPMDTVKRNYEDPNHKPELIFALTPSLTMNAFRESSEIAALLQPVSTAHPAITHFLEEPSAERLSYLFASLLSMRDGEKSHALAILRSALDSQQGEPWQTIRLIANVYPNDSGLFSPLLLNMVKLSPGEVMFLFAETPHAYLQGVALEVAANSDNMLHVGLVPKYIDTPELVANVKFIAKPTNQLLTTPAESDDELDFPVLIDDLTFSLHELTTSDADINQQSAAILLYIEGEAVLSKDEQRLVLRPGESVFVGVNGSPVNISGAGRLARAYNKL